MEKITHVFEGDDIPNKLRHRAEKAWRDVAGHPHHEETMVEMTSITVEFNLYEPHEFTARHHSHDDPTGFYDYASFQKSPERKGVNLPIHLL